MSIFDEWEKIEREKKEAWFKTPEGIAYWKHIDAKIAQERAREVENASLELSDEDEDEDEDEDDTN